MSATPQPNYAQIHERFLARMLDGIITLPFLQIITALFAAHAGLASIVGFVLGLMYYAWFSASGWQATPGKRIVGIHVTRADGSRLSLREATAREIAALAPTFPVYVSFFSQQMAATLFVVLACVWYIRIAVSPERTGLHDEICATRVVRGRLGGSWNAS